MNKKQNYGSKVSQWNKMESTDVGRNVMETPMWSLGLRIEPDCATGYMKTSPARKRLSVVHADEGKISSY